MSPPRQQRGMALLAAILLVAMGTILAASIAYDNAMSARRGTATLSLDEAVLAAEAAEALAAYVLSEDRKGGGGNLDHAGERWGQPLGPVEIVPGVMLSAALTDMQGRFNLNNLVNNDGVVDQDQLQVFQSLLRKIGLEEKWASLIADWIDTDDQPLQPDGAEDINYLSQIPPYRAPNTSITSVSELLALPEFGRDRYRRLSPYVSALPRGALLNICTAPAVLLDAFASGYEQVDKDDFATDPVVFAKGRQSGCFPTVQDFEAIFDDKPAYATKQINTKFGTSSNYFRLTSIVAIGTTEFALYSLMERQGTGGANLSRPILRSYTAD